MLRLILELVAVILLFIWNVEPIAGCLHGSNHDFGFLDPRGDNFFRVNSSHKFRCSLRNHEFNYNNTTVHANCSDLQVSVNSRNFTTRCVDDLTVEFEVNNATVKDSGYYICKTQKTMICMANYQFGYDPLPVKNFSCISEAFQKLKCSWKRSANPVPTNYSISYTSDYNYHYLELGCPKNKSYPQPKDTCEWTLFTSQIYYRNAQILNFRVTGVNVLGTWTQTYTLNHHELIRAGVPMKLRVTNVTETRAVITWDTPDMMPTMVSPPILYELGYRAEYEDYEDPYTEVLVGPNLFRKEMELIPNLEYSIRLRCRVVNATNLWSDYVTTRFKTKPDVPYLAPVIINQLFEVKNFEYRGTRTITLYWKGVPSKYCNGENCVNVITASVTNVARRKRTMDDRMKMTIREIPLNENFTTFSDLSLTEDYQFTIKVKNNQGESENSSRIVVPKQNKIPNLPSDVAASSNKRGYNVTWKPSDSNDIISYTIVKCRDSHRSQDKCTGEIDWIHVPANKKYHNFDIPYDSYYNFGVASTNKENVSSGLQWVPCVAPYNRVLDRIRNVQVYNMSETQLKVTKSLDCSSWDSLVTNFSIRYSSCNDSTCLTCGEPKEKNYTNDGRPDLILGNLEPFTIYSVKIAVRTKAGPSEYSDKRCVTTNSAAPADPPHDLEFKNITANSAVVSWKPPKKPNGNINEYSIIYYSTTDNKNPPVTIHSDGRNQTSFNYTLGNLTAYERYSVQIEACVNDQRRLCTKSGVENFLTLINEPGVMNEPYVSVSNRTVATIKWEKPKHPNGPIDFYIIEWRRENPIQNESSNTRNVSGTSEDSSLDIDCGDDETPTPFLFYMRAVNIVKDKWLIGPESKMTKESFCFVGPAHDVDSLTIGVTIGIVLALVPLSVILYMLVDWMRKKYDIGKNVPEIELPPGLVNHTSSYDNFKNGLQCNPDASPKPAYGRLDSFISNDDSFKNRHGSGTSQFSATSTDELITKQNIITEKAKRNPSGDSSGCGSTGGGHDSLSSSLTHRTNLSSDSGNEADLKNPPSPEVVRVGEVLAVQPEEKSLNVSCVSGSKDSGVDKGDDSDEKSKSPVSPYSQFSSCIDSSNKALGSYSPPAPYSKFGMEPSCYVPVSRGRNLQLYGHNLANSEPSINEMDEVNPYSCVRADPRLEGTVLYPTTLAGQYSKLGLSHSIQDILGCKSFVIDKNETLMNNGSRNEDGAILPYSRFGMRRMESPSDVKNPYLTVGMVLSMTDDKDPKELLRQKESPWLPPHILLRRNDKGASPGKVDLSDEGFENSDVVDKDNMAYSKIGLGEADYAAHKDFNLAIKPFEAPSTSKSGEGYVGLDNLKIFPISQLVANSEKSDDLDIAEIKNDIDQRVDDIGGIAPYSCIIPSFNEGQREESQEPFSLQNLDKNYTPPSYDDLDQTFTPAKSAASANGYVSRDVLLQNSKRNLDRTSFDSLNPSNELLPKPELKERLPDVNVKRSNGYVTISELPSICGGQEVRFDMPITDV